MGSLKSPALPAATAISKSLRLRTQGIVGAVLRMLDGISEGRVDGSRLGLLDRSPGGDVDGKELVTWLGMVLG